MKIVAVTSCPTGIAHTYMAAEALEQAAKDAGHDIKVETQGAAGAEAVADADIAAADAVVFAADVEVRNRERFAGKPLVQTSVKRAINDAPGLIAEAEAAARAGGAGGVMAGAAAEAREAARHGDGRPARDQGRPGRRPRHPAAPVADDRGQLHDPVRGRGRHPDRPGLPARRARGGQQGQRRHLPGRGVPGRRGPVQADRAGRLRRAAVQDRRRRLLHAGPDPGRLHRLRHGRPAGPGRRHRRRPDLGRDQRRVPGRPDRRPARRRGRHRSSSRSRCRVAWPASCRWWSSRWCRPSWSAR